MRALMLEEVESVSGGKAENSGNGGVCGGSGCGGTSGGGSGTGGQTNGGGGNSGGGGGSRPDSIGNMRPSQAACYGLGVAAGQPPDITDKICGTNVNGHNSGNNQFGGPH